MFVWVISQLRKFGRAKKEQVSEKISEFITVIMEHHANGTRYVANNPEEQVKVDEILKYRFCYTTPPALIIGSYGIRVCRWE